jgi:amino acid adenylation domain-containing protein
MTVPGDGDRVRRLEEAIRSRKAAARASVPDIAPRPAGEPAHLGELQRGLWVVHQMDPYSAAYNLASAFRVHGPLDVAKLQRAFNEVVARHRLLRSTFRAEGDTVLQVVHPPVPLPLETLEAGPDGALAIATREARTPFDLEHGPLVRMRVIEDGSGRGRLLVLVLHHILADERSLGCLWKQLADAYEGRPSAAGPPVQYDDYVHWSRRGGHGRHDEGLAYWRGRLDPLPDDLRLPFERPAGSAPAQGRLLGHVLSPTVQAGIRRLATSVGATPFMVYAFVFKLLLHRYTDGQRVAFATPVSTRSHPATADMIGYFLNPVVVSAGIDEQEGVEEAVRGFGRELRDALAHASVPFDVLAARLSPPRMRDRHPLFQAMFVHQEARPAPAFGEAHLEPVALDLGASKFDLTLFVTDGEGSLATAVEYRADRFDDVWMQGLLGHYETLLEQLPRRPDGSVAEVPMLGAAEERELRAREQGPRLEGAAADLLPRQILDQARRQPQSAAVTCGGVSQSYGELEATARWVARALSERGVQPGDRVGVFIDRRLQLVAGLLGSLWAGAAYVPLDPAYPDARNRGVLEDADLAAVVTTSALRGRLPVGPWATIEVDTLDLDGAPSAALADLSPESPAYILYTSGSTGRPKGIVVSHDNLRWSTAARLQVYDTPPARFLLVPSIAFDSSVAGLFWTLAAGGTLVVPTDEQARDARRLAQLVAEERVTSLLCVPSLYEQLLRAGGDQLRGLEIAIVAGESCPSRLVEEHRQAVPHARLFNEYGPTEATVWATVHEITAEDAARPVAVGRPIPGVRVEVLDAVGRRVPVGIPGHAWIAGPTVARGYWRRPDLSDERFLVQERGPATTERRYRTGDRMAWTPDGRLLFLGRDDEQVKLRGFRIEPGEIEAALLALPSVAQAAVVARLPGSGQSPAAGSGTEQLVAFIVTTGAGGAGGWRPELAKRLPDFMVPSRLVELPELPRLPNGKVDRRRLRDLVLEPDARAVEDDRIPSTREQALLSLWEGLLGRFGIGVTDNFFELGGHSLLVVEMASAIERDFTVTLSAADVFANPTVRDLARRIDQREGPQARAYEHLFPIQPSGPKTPFFMAIPHFFTEMLATRFRGERPVYGLRGVGLRTEGNRGRWRTMTDLAEELVDEIRRRFPHEAVILGGYSFGASMAIEAARVMERRGIPARRLYVIAPMPVDVYRVGPVGLQIEGLRQPLDGLPFVEALRLYARGSHPLTRRPYERAWRWLTVQPWRRLLCAAGAVRRRAGLPLTPRILHADVRLERFRLHARYRPGPVHTPTVFFNAIGTKTDAAATWRPYFQGSFTVHEIPDPHDEASVEAARQAILPHLADLGDP